MPQNALNELLSVLAIDPEAMTDGERARVVTLVVAVAPELDALEKVPALCVPPMFLLGNARRVAASLREDAPKIDPWYREERFQSVPMAEKIDQATVVFHAISRLVSSERSTSPLADAPRTEDIKAAFDLHQRLRFAVFYRMTGAEKRADGRPVSMRAVRVLGDDLGRLAGIIEKNFKQFTGRSDVTAGDLEKASGLSLKLCDPVRDAEALRDEVNGDLRDRSAEYLRGLLLLARRAAHIVFDEATLDERYPLPFSGVPRKPRKAAKKPVETKPAETKPAETKPAETTPR